MKANLKRVIISAATLFLFMAFVAPAVSGSDYASTDYAPPSNTLSYLDPNIVAPEKPVYEPVAEPEPDIKEEPTLEPMAEPEPDTQEDPLPENEESEPSIETEEISADMPQEDEDPATPDVSNLEMASGKGKSNPQGKGFWRNLFRIFK
ncbi:MAG: hypothetical protein V3U20_11135 [Thermoplasmata archaeon]